MSVFSSVLTLFNVVDLTIDISLYVWFVFLAEKMLTLFYGEGLPYMLFLHGTLSIQASLSICP